MMWVQISQLESVSKKSHVISILALRREVSILIRTLKERMSMTYTNNKSNTSNYGTKDEVYQNL